MRRGALFLGFLMAITLAGGALTANIGIGLPTMLQSTDPAASVFQATPGQALAFFAWVGFVLVNVIGAGLTLAAVFWFLNREVRVAEETPKLAERENAAELPEAASKSA